jgi:hypothetical protein
LLRVSPAKGNQIAAIAGDAAIASSIVPPFVIEIAMGYLSAWPPAQIR